MSSEVIAMIVSLNSTKNYVLCATCGKTIRNQVVHDSKFSKHLEIVFCK